MTYKSMAIKFFVFSLSLIVSVVAFGYTGRYIGAHLASAIPSGTLMLLSGMALLGIILYSIDKFLTWMFGNYSILWEIWVWMIFVVLLCFGVYGAMMKRLSSAIS